MPDITPKEITALHDLLTHIGPNISLAISEQINLDVMLDAPAVESVPIQDLLVKSDIVLATVFSLSAPHTAESMFFFSEETGRIFADLIEGKDGADPPSVLTDDQNEKLSNAMTGVARGIAAALSNLSGDIIDLEACTTHIGPLTLPPVFALSGDAIQITLTLTIPDVREVPMTFLFTPEVVLALVPPAGENASSQAAADDGILGADELAAMLSDIGTFPADPPAPSGHAEQPAGGGTPFQPAPAAAPESVLPRGMELILDIPLDVTVELGRVRMLIKDVLELSSGSIVELDRVAGEPVDLLVNGRLIAKGEVVVIEDNFGIRITEIISPADRVASLGKGR